MYHVVFTFHTTGIRKLAFQYKTRRAAAGCAASFNRTHGDELLATVEEVN